MQINNRVRFELLYSTNQKFYVNTCKGKRIVNTTEMLDTKQAAEKYMLSMSKDMDQMKMIVVKDFINYVTYKILNGQKVTEKKKFNPNIHPTAKPF